MTFADFLSMGGYGFYVWGAYFVSVAAILIEVVAVRARLRGAHRLADSERDAEMAAR
jgi:heme exporter protein D